MQGDRAEGKIFWDKRKFHYNWVDQFIRQGNNKAETMPKLQMH